VKPIFDTVYIVGRLCVELGKLCECLHNSSQQMYLDDLPVYGFVGKIEKLVKAKGAAVLRFYLFTHFHFQILWNEDNIIESEVYTNPQV
jgi:hypothetical protein